MLRIILGIIFLASVSVLICCTQTAANNASNPAGSIDDSPTGAYKRLYTAVKAKNIKGIKAAMSKKSLDFAKMAGAQQNKPFEQVLENGFTATTFSPALPQIRDERVNGDMAALEVHNDKDNIWEDLPFVREDGQWKLAIGEMFAGTWKSPGEGQAQKEKEAANAMSNNLRPMNANVNGNFNGVHPNVQPPAANGK